MFKNLMAVSPNVASRIAGMESSEPIRIRRHCIYRGRVQGVGFRYTTMSIARRYEVKGYVKNLPNRSVELVVEGESNVVQDFLAEISRVLRTNIVDCSCRDMSTEQTARFRGFEVRY